MSLCGINWRPLKLRLLTRPVPSASCSQVHDLALYTRSLFSKFTWRVLVTVYRTPCLAARALKGLQFGLQRIMVIGSSEIGMRFCCRGALCATMLRSWLCCGKVGAAVKVE
jgi:hypothetical protein